MRFAARRLQSRSEVRTRVSIVRFQEERRLAVGCCADIMNRQRKFVAYKPKNLLCRLAAHFIEQVFWQSSTVVFEQLA